jgi:hypothetical protein
LSNKRFQRRPGGLPATTRPEVPWPMRSRDAY